MINFENIQQLYRIRLVAGLLVTLFGSGVASADKSVDNAQKSGLSYAIVDTNQSSFYNAIFPINAPKTPSEAFFGQDAQYKGNQPSYTVSNDGLVVSDHVTGLMWQRSPDTNGDGSISVDDKMPWSAAQSYPDELNEKSFAGYDDWRLPTIKELYSLIQFSGTDPSGFSGGDTSALTPFIDAESFAFAWGDVANRERIIDSQYASSNLYIDQSSGMQLLFGVNFADGRIKGYGLKLHGSDKTFSVICVRGNKEYGTNHFVDNGDEIITDMATGLSWAKSDSGKAMNWQQALAWVQSCNADNYLGRSDWRLPNVKELHSILDYTRSPGTSDSPAIDPLFQCTAITNENGEKDYPFYWSGTTHAAFNGSARAGCYVAFGRSPGYMNGRWIDVHGAGSQRSDPKSGDPDKFKTGRGPQGDAIRINNYVRLVCGGTATLVTEGPAVDPSQQVIREEPVEDQQSQQPGMGLPPEGGQPPSAAEFISRLDKDGDGKVSQKEFDGPADHFNQFDTDGDGKLSESEVPKGPPQGGKNMKKERSGRR